MTGGAHPKSAGPIPCVPCFASVTGDVVDSIFRECLQLETFGLAHVYRRLSSVDNAPLLDTMNGG